LENASLVSQRSRSVELIKNSFDADASTCRIEFRKDEIVVSDNGIGMSARDFLRYWMIIGTTPQSGQSKITDPFRRPLTGSKGSEARRAIFSRMK